MIGLVGLLVLVVIIAAPSQKTLTSAPAAHDS
jgi:hypothetical protein